MSTHDVVPDGVKELEAAYGPPSQAGFGSAVFTAKLDENRDLERVAREIYRRFVGDLWERYGEEAWMGPWKLIYVRSSGSTPDIVSELRGITDAQASMSVPMLLETVDDADAARAALAAVFDDPAIEDLRVFTLGDGGAMSGLLVGGARVGSGEATFLVFLMD